MFAVLVLAAIIIILAFPYIRTFVRRKRFFSALKRICVSRLYDIKIGGGAGIYFANSDAPYDLIIDTGKLLLRIKLWSEPYRASTLIFKPDGEVIRRKKISDVFADGEHRTHKIYQRKAGKINIGAEKILSTKRTLSFFVFDRADVTIFYADRKGLSRVYFDEKLYGMTILPSAKFIKKLMPKD